MSMQASDGGVYWRLCSRTWDHVLPSDVELPRMIYEKTTRATAMFAGMAAIHSRLIRPYNSARADEVLEAGEKAWEFLQTHESYPPEGTTYTNPTEYPGGGTYADSSSYFNQLWGAAELYRTTGNATYQDAYKELLTLAHLDPSAAPSSTYMWWAMVMSDHDNVDVVLRENARRAIMGAADMKIERAAIHPYRVPKHPYIQWSGWHGQSGSVIYAPALLQAYYLSGNITYSNEAYMSIDMSFGANPMSQCFVTGLGHKPVTDPLDIISRDDGVDIPVPGMPSPGFTWHLPGFREPYISVNNAFYPTEIVTNDMYNESYPVLRRYVDSFSVIPHNEGTISEAGKYAAALSIMGADGNLPPKVDGSYQWVSGSRTNVIHVTNVPLHEVPLINPDYIRQWGGSVGHAPAEYLNAFTTEQVCAINASNIPYWVGRMNETTKQGLCQEQVESFVHYTLFTALLPSQVPWIPCERIPTIPAHSSYYTAEWIAALTGEQIGCMTSQQLSALALTAPPSAAPNDDPGNQGDPIIVGLQGQIFKFEGRDGAWYSNLASRNIQWNMQFKRFDACPADANMFISGISFSTFDTNDNSMNSNILIATTPDTIPECRNDPNLVCLGDGTLHISLDGGKSFISAPGDYHYSSQNRVVAHNTYGACSRKWHDYEISDNNSKGHSAVRAGGRRTTMYEKKPLQLMADTKQTMIDPLECNSWIEDRINNVDLFQQRGEWSTIYIQGPFASLHIEYRQSDWFNPTCRFQSLDSWMTTVSARLEKTEWHGILGETKNKVYDASRNQIKSDRSQLLRGKDDADYEVEGPFGTNFAAALEQRSNGFDKAITSVLESVFPHVAKSAL